MLTPSSWIETRRGETKVENCAAAVSEPDSAKVAEPDRGYLLACSRYVEQIPASCRNLDIGLRRSSLAWLSRNLLMYIQTIGQHRTPKILTIIMISSSSLRYPCVCKQSSPWQGHQDILIHQISLSVLCLFEAKQWRVFHKSFTPSRVSQGIMQ